MYRKIMVFAVALFTVFFTGCYDSNEIESLATVMAVGVENSDSENVKRYTFAVAKLTGENEGDKASFVCYSQSAPDVFSAIKDLNRKLSKKLSFSHTSLILYSADAAAKGMYDDVKYFEDHSKIRPQTLMALTTFSPQKYLETLSPALEANAEKYFRNILKDSKSNIAHITLNDFIDAYHCQKELIFPVLGGASENNNQEQNAFVTSAAFVKNGIFVKMQPLEE